MDVLLSLPEETAREIVSNWLSLTILTKLDVAYCNRSSRIAFLALITDLRTPFSNSLIGRSNYFRYTEMLHWINSKTLLIRNLSIFSGSDTNRLQVTQSYLNRSSRTIERVELIQVHDHARHSLRISVNLIARYGANLKELGLSYLVNLSVVELRVLGEACPLLVKLQLDYCEVVSHNDWSHTLPQYWPQLQHLSVSHTICSDDDLIVIAQGCRQLTHLDVSKCEVTDISVFAVAAHCSRLQFISLNENNVGDESITALARGCPLLLEVLLGVNDRVTDACLHALAVHCRALHSVDLCECEQITDHGLELLAQHCHQLRSLDVAECLSVTEHGVMHVAQHCTQLQSLRIHETAASDELLQRLGEKVTVCERFNQDDWMLEPGLNLWRGSSNGDVHELDIDGESRSVFSGRGRVNSDY